ncbi:hypothetical protein L5515_010626 [Caenorhabditis briggsae]|uniref:Methylosome subunit pICln n=1 Tax=Caenorhabditis briggsae TaxID=6238 RepID=A0AAE9EML3_CAEBR|nr:hypothetical protein L3Y34_003473 [Caenorhabditis briggsae]UMM27256.1 hypothetical protein L5515_010626 [Caenorhabditis briggsae]
MAIILKEVSAPTAGIKITTPNVQAFHNSDSLGNGTLYVTGSEVTWISSAPGSKGFSVTYPAIVLHAISTDTTTFPSEHVFMMVDQRKSSLELAAAELEGEESDNDDEEGPGLEIRFVPDDKEALTPMYHEILKGQEENPEEDDMMFEDEEEQEDGEYEMEEGDEQAMGSGQWFTADNIDQLQMSEEGLANMQRIFGRGDQQPRQDDSME